MAGQDIPTKERYELVSTLGKGGMAEVFLGWMNSVGGLKRKVAIKRILPDLIKKQSKLFEQMFVDEARLAFQLEHDNIVRVYDVGQSANTFFIVMEYVEGMDLKRIYEKLQEQKKFMPLNMALYIAAQVASGLSYAHTFTDEDGNPMGLVHNDISPPNIMVSRHGEVKVADFGLSDAVSNDVETPEGMVKGKFAYISPESTKDPSLVSAQSDIFSVGIVTWEIIAGQRLFQRDTDLDTFMAVRDAVIPDIRTIRPEVPEEIVKVLNRALATNPKDRYPSVKDFFDDVLKASYHHNLQLNRYDVVRLVHELSDGELGGFKGEKVSDNVLNELRNELEEMIPPGVAAHLNTFVTGASVAEDVPTSEVQEDWVADVFDDVGFDDAELGEAGFGDEKRDPEPPPEPEKPKAPEKLKEPDPPPAAKAQPKAAEEKRKPSVPKKTPAKPTQTSPTSLPKEVVERLQEEMQTQIKSQKMTAIIWGLVMGIVLGAAIGVSIGMLL